ncbi:Translocon-associated protein (TRAP), alpha subunit [Parasponia andersonii]|uniref:Translocon-associated protein subunit alpha n=1 Tax=Parasponia andersonii TaxID=3476 RepID=A0A2P5C209_PARAD|nr:Translocon-associated protein (TRAP), alpha subunit [Parasponia andersonii]
MVPMKLIRVFFLALLLIASPFLQGGSVSISGGNDNNLLSFVFSVARGQSDSDSDVSEAVEESSDLGIVGEDVQDFGDGNFSPAPGIHTVSVFPKNSARLVTAGEETELLVGIKNDGDSSVNVIAIKASVHLPFDHNMLVQNLSALSFNNASVPATAQATFPYIFAVSKYLQPGSFDLVGTIIYEIDQHPYQSTFYNGTIEVVEAGGFLSIESVFLVTLGIALLVLLVLWVHGQIQRLSKKTKRAPKVEVGTKTTDASMDEWLQGTAFTQSLSSKSKKKK